MSPTCLSSFSIDSGKYHNLLWWFLQPFRIISFSYITVKSFIVNVKINPALYSAPMDTSEWFLFRIICFCLAVLGNIVKSNSPYIMDVIICILGDVSLAIFVVGCTLFRRADTSMKFIVRPESATVERSCSIFFLFFLLEIDYYLQFFYAIVICSI